MEMYFMYVSYTMYVNFEFVITKLDILEFLSYVQIYV